MRPTGPCPGPSTVPPRGPGPLWGAIRVPLISFPDAAAPATCSVPCRRGDTCRGRLRTLRNTFQGTFSSGTSRWEEGLQGRSRVPGLTAQRAGAAHAPLGRPRLPPCPPPVPARTPDLAGPPAVTPPGLVWAPAGSPVPVDAGSLGVPGRRSMARPLAGVCQTPFSWVDRGRGVGARCRRNSAVTSSDLDRPAVFPPVGLLYFNFEYFF